MAKLTTRVAAIALVVLAGCGSRADHSDLQVAVPPAEEGAEGEGGGEGGQAGGEGGGETTTTADPEEATREITTIVEEGINGANLADVEAGVAKVEEGDSVRATIEQVASNPGFSTAEAQVKEVEVLDEEGCEGASVESPCAQVTFDILLNGQVALPDYKGYAVEREDTWLISKTSFCDLVGLAGLTCP
jgi:hypothetical protein